jgi:hypothetical protein
VAGVEDDDEREAMRDRLDRGFRDLQAENADVENLKMFAVGDYELDPGGLEWSRDFRGRNRELLDQALAERSVPDGFNDVPLRYTDLHSDEEIAEFENRARISDPNGNATWQDPMPESDFDPDADIDFRDWGPAAEAPIDPETEAALRARASPRRCYDSEEDERAALMETFEKFDNAAMIHAESDQLKFKDDEPVPTSEEYQQWQRAAEERGGNACLGDSHELSPAKLETDFDIREEHFRERSYDEAPNNNLMTVPHQYKTILECHGGEWTGVLSVFSINDNLALENVDIPDADGNGEKAAKEEVSDEVRTAFHPAKANLSFEVTTKVSERPNVGLEWLMTSEDLPAGSPDIGLAAVARRDQPDALSPGRAVFDDGSYVAEVADMTVFADKSGGKMKPGSNDGSLSISDAMLATLVGESSADEPTEVRGVAEICIVGDCGTQRRRTVLCAVNGHVTHVISLCEARGVDPKATAACRRMMEEFASMESILGTWTGKGVSLHPFFPPLAISEMTSELDLILVDRAPEPQTLTYLKEEMSNETTALETDGESVPPSRQNRDKLSKRVQAALARDGVRLSRCRVLSTEMLQSIMRESCAWESRSSALRSPRLGPWAPDYFALSLPGEVVLIAAIGPWQPRVRTRFELLHATRPVRRRMIAARSTEGCVTGAALLREEVAE